MADKLVVPFRGVGKVSSTAVALYDMFGTQLPIYLSTTALSGAISPTTLTVGGTAVTANGAELNYLDIATLGTGAASKAVVLDAGDDYVWPATGILTYGVLKDPAGTTLGATVAEINALDISANTETIDVSAAVDATKTFTKIASTGAGAITLAAPGAEMLGRTKVIEMISGDHDVTLALTNVTGGSAATTCTWTNTNEALVLVGGTNKWHVVAESGVVLS